MEKNLLFTAFSQALLQEYAGARTREELYEFAASAHDFEPFSLSDPLHGEPYPYKLKEIGLTAEEFPLYQRNYADALLANIRRFADMAQTPGALSAQDVATLGNRYLHLSVWGFESNSQKTEALETLFPFLRLHHQHFVGQIAYDIALSGLEDGSVDPEESIGGVLAKILRTRGTHLQHRPDTIGEYLDGGYGTWDVDTLYKDDLERMSLQEWTQNTLPWTTPPRQG